LSSFPQEKNNNEETKSVITFLISKDFIVIWIC
jgi:hypothetical protein